MNIKKIVKLAIVLASLIALSQTGLPSAIADALTPAAVGSTATVAQTAKNADVATTSNTNQLSICLERVFYAVDANPSLIGYN